MDGDVWHLDLLVVGLAVGVVMAAVSRRFALTGPGPVAIGAALIAASASTGRMFLALGALSLAGRAVSELVSRRAPSWSPGERVAVPMAVAGALWLATPDTEGPVVVVGALVPVALAQGVARHGDRSPDPLVGVMALAVAAVDFRGRPASAMVLLVAAVVLVGARLVAPLPLRARGAAIAVMLAVLVAAARTVGLATDLRAALVPAWGLAALAAAPAAVVRAGLTPSLPRRPGGVRRWRGWWR